MRILGIDYGDSRIGIAMSDSLGWMAQGVETITWKDSIKKPISRIIQIVTENNIDKIIVGYPKNMDGSIGKRAELTDLFISKVRKELDDRTVDLKSVQIIKWDERLTTVAANRVIHEIGIKRSKKKGIVDQIAAVYILQGYLDSIGKTI